MNKQEILTSEKKPPVPIIDASKIPDEMRHEKRWIKWKWIRKDGKWTKKPIGKWRQTQYQTNFDKAHDAVLTGKADGIGYVLRDGHAGIDLDDAIVDGEFTKFAKDILRVFDGAYVETSPTGTGLKIFFKGTKRVKKCKNSDGTLEIYDNGRWFVVTTTNAKGDFVDCQEQLDIICQRELTGHAPRPTSSATGVHEFALKRMLSIEPKEGEVDSSNRLFAVSCRAAGQGLSEQQYLETLLAYSKAYPFRKQYTREEFLKRY